MEPVRKGMGSMIFISDAVRTQYPKAHFAMMKVKGFRPDFTREKIDQVMEEELEEIRNRHASYDRKDFSATAPVLSYGSYYKRFKKTYPLIGQLESVVIHGKKIPPVGIPVEVMFLAELKNLILTAGHNLEAIEGPLAIDVATEPISYIGISGKETRVVPNDLYVRDERGVLSSILNGPDHRTRIDPKTENVVYFAYGVEGVTKEELYHHLHTIASFLCRAAKGVEIGSIDIL